MEIKLNRIDYIQVGLTSSSTLRIINPGSTENQMTVLAVIGDHTGSVMCFSIKSESSSVSTIFKTLPGPNARINNVQIIGGSSASSTSTASSPKILVSFGSSVIRGYTCKGKQFFGLELNNLTEPIKHLQVQWPNEIFICGHFIYNHYMLTSQVSQEHGRSTVIHSKNFYVSPGKVTGLIVIENPLNKQLVCEYEIETCGIPTTLYSFSKCSREKEGIFIYGTLEGKVALVSLDFSQEPLVAVHKWEIPEKGSRSQVACIAMMETTGELYIGRSNGSIEVWVFSESLEADGNQSIDVDSSPILRTEYNCGECLTSICVCRNGTFLLCSTFTGFIFGLTRNQPLDFGATDARRTLPSLKHDLESKIDFLKSEVSSLEKRLMKERQSYQEIGLGGFKGLDRSNLSVLPYFAIDGSMILHEDASYLLSFETQVAIDLVIIQSDIPLDLVDCERNSAVVSLNKNCSEEILATFRCQANTTQLEVKIRPIEGQSGILRVYVITRMTPKSCQVKNFTIKALSLHRRSYTNDNFETSDNLNSLHIYGSFSLNEGFSWLQMCLPEIPERINTSASQSVKYMFTSTLIATNLLVNCAKGSLSFHSDNVSTISILKDFITREATKKSIPIEMKVKISVDSLSHTIRKMFPRLKALIQENRRSLLREAVDELRINDALVADSLSQQLEENDLSEKSLGSIQRLYGLITDLFIDYYKVDGSSSSKIAINNVRSRISQLSTLIETYSGDQYSDEKVLVEKLAQFWDLPTTNKWKK